MRKGNRGEFGGKAKRSQRRALPSRWSSKVGSTQQAASHESVAHILQRFAGQNLVVIDGNGVAHGEQASRQMYWSDVCEGIRERGAACLPDMAGLGSLMNLSILDVKIPVIDFESGEENQEDILPAMFLLEQVGCFQWLVEHARRHGCDWAAMGRLFGHVVRLAQGLEEETPRMAMAKMFVRFMAESFHRKGYLEQAIADSGKTMGQPFARRIAEDYLAELAAKSERGEIEATIANGAFVEARQSRRI